MAANSAFQFLKILVILQRRIRPRFFVSEMLFREKNYPLRMPELYPSPDGSELCFCPTTGGLSDKNARSARRARFSQVEPQNFYRMTRQRKCNTQSPTPSYKYSFRLSEEYCRYEVGSDRRFSFHLSYYNRTSFGKGDLDVWTVGSRNTDG